MEDTRITFETAKLAKEKGWNGDFVESHKILTTQSLLAKWLRDKYSIRVYPIQKISGDFGFEIYIPNKDNPVGRPFERLAYFTLHFKTYEEAYEIGLQEALKLIDNK